MKVQRKQGHEQYDVFEQTDKYYLAKADYWRNIIALPKTDYEPVQEWVTLYCLKDEWPCDRLKHDLRAYWQGEFIVIQRKATR